MKLSSSRVLSGIALAAALVLLYGWRLGARSFWEPDEPRYGEIAREMLVSGDWVTPRLDFLKYYEKPPLAYWSAAVSFALFGVSEASGRLSPVFFSLLFLAGTWVLARTLFGEREAAASTLVLALAPLSWVTGRLLVTDMFLAAGVVWVLAGYVLALDRVRRGRGAVLPMSIAGAGAAVALLAKGPIGVLLPALGVVPFRLLAGRAASIGMRGWGAAGAVVALVGLPWFLLLSWRDPSFVGFFVWHEHVLRYLTHEAKREGPLWYYVGVLAGGLFPSSLLLPWAVARCRPRLRERGWKAQGMTLLLLFAVAALVFFSVSQSKRPGYILPALPVPAILVGCALSRALGSRREGVIAPGAIGAGADDRRVASSLRLSLAFAAIASWLGCAAAIHFVRRPSEALVAAHGAFSTGIALAILGICLAAPALRPRGSVLRWSLAAGAVAMCAALLSIEDVAERVDGSVSAKPAALLAARAAGPDDLLASYGTVLQGLTFYARRRTAIVGGPGELAFGAQAQEAQGWVIPPGALSDLLARRTVYLVTPKGLTPRALAYGAGQLRILEETPAYTVLTNKKSEVRSEKSGVRPSNGEVRAPPSRASAPAVPAPR